MRSRNKTTPFDAVEDAKSAIRWVRDHAADLGLPTLLMHGTADPITSAQASIEFAQRTAGKCTLKTWPALYHELHWERDRDEVIQFALDWMATV